MASIIDTLQKLIAHEKSARTVGSIAEAEAFASRIQELLTKYKLSITEVEAEALDANDPIGESELVSAKVKNDEWILILAQGVAANFYCRALNLWWNKVKGKRRPNASISFVGRTSDREAAISMFCYLGDLGISLAGRKLDKMDSSDTITNFRANTKANGVPVTESEKIVRNMLKKYRADFLIGFSHALNLRLTKNRKLFEVNASETASGLIRRDELAIEEFIHSRGRTGSSEIGFKEPEDEGAFLAGYFAGAAIGLEARASLEAGKESGK